MTDHYKTLNVTFSASRTEIRKRYRKLAIIHHPDKNAGSKKSEEIFKQILDSYEILSNAESRAIYDSMYKRYCDQLKSENINRNNSTTKRDPPKQETPRNRANQKPEKTRPKENYIFLVIAVFIICFYLYNTYKTTTTGNPKADTQLKQQPETRPESGELDFNK
ncbi:MAG: DnaJ domain-containing protein [Saprospiraceae bacterium]